MPAHASAASFQLNDDIAYSGSNPGRLLSLSGPDEVYVRIVEDGSAEPVLRVQLPAGGSVIGVIGVEARVVPSPEVDPDNGDKGHPERGQGFWTWVFRALHFTVFKIQPSRGSDVLLETLGRDFDGVLGCDYFSAYRKYMRECSVRVQFCQAEGLDFQRATFAE